jgi:hypothetical protein
MNVATSTIARVDVKPRTISLVLAAFLDSLYYKPKARQSMCRIAVWSLDAVRLALKACVPAAASSMILNGVSVARRIVENPP